MILLSFENQNYTINEDYELTPENEILSQELEYIKESYTSPAQGFLTSYIAEQLRKLGLDVLDVYDEQMETDPDGLVY